jgi:hypothetical protein
LISTKAYGIEIAKPSNTTPGSLIQGIFGWDEVAVWK